MKKYLLLAFLISLTSTAFAMEDVFDLIGQLHVQRNDQGADSANLTNSLYLGLDGFAGSLSLNISNADKALSEQLKKANGKWVGLCGLWEQKEKREVVLRPTSVAVLGDGFQLVGKIIQYAHPDGSMAGTEHAIVDAAGDVFPLRFAETVPMQDLLLNQRVSVLGSFQHDGHKGLLMSFKVEKMEKAPSKALSDSRVLAAEASDLALSLHQRTEKGEVVLDILVSNVSTNAVEIVSEGIAPAWSVWAWFQWEIDGKPVKFSENVAVVWEAKESWRIPKGGVVLWASIPVRSLKHVIKNDKGQKESVSVITDAKPHSITIMPGRQWQKQKLSLLEAVGNAPRKDQKELKVKSGSIEIGQDDNKPPVRSDEKSEPQP